MVHSRSGPTRSLPEKPSVAQLRKQAKELLKAFRAGEGSAIAEVERFERVPEPEQFSLADAQRVLARAYGFSSWTRIKQHVDGLNTKAFCEAADSGVVAEVRRLARARPELVNGVGGGTFGEKTALHLAVLNRDAEMTRVLMELGSDARKGFWPHRDATSALTIARDRGDDEIAGIIEQAEERRRMASSTPGATISSLTDEIQKLIRADRRSDAIGILEEDLSLLGASNIRGATPLHFAASAHDPEMVTWLLDRQASVDARDTDGRTPLDYASIVAGWSSHGRDFSFVENSRIEPARFHETVRLLRAGGAELTPRAAVAIGDADAVRRLHRERRLVNDIHFYRGGLLSIAVRVNRIDMVALLLDLGLDPDETATPSEDGGRSWGMPLWFAAMCGRHEIAELLLERGADVNAIVHACGDALCIADGTDDDRMQTLLLQHGARLTVERIVGRGDRKTVQAILDGTVSAESLNVDKPSRTDLADQMLWAGARCDPEIVRMCLPHVQRQPDDPWWNYVLVHVRFPEGLSLILEHGVDPDVTGDGGYTILHHLASDYVNDLDRVLFATILLDAGASLEKRDPLLQSTPLGWACRWGRSELVELYLQRGIDAVEAEAEPWATPMAWAEKGGHHDIIRLLRSYGAQ